MFFREVVVWKRLQHPNVVPFLGAAAKIPPFEIVCVWMEHDRITEYVRKNPGVDRFDLVGKFVSIVTIFSQRSDFKFRSCGMWWMVFTTSTPAT